MHTQAVKTISYSEERRGEVVARVTFNAAEFAAMSEEERVAAATVRASYSHDLLPRLTATTYFLMTVKLSGVRSRGTPMYPYA